MTGSEGTMKGRRSARVNCARKTRAPLSNQVVWRRCTVKDYRGRLESRQNHAWQLAPDDVTWESICRKFAVLNVSLAPESENEAVCAACEARVMEQEQQEGC
jgi:hypothetical protein